MRYSKMQQEQIQQSQDQGSFILGLTVGLFAGAASYFLFATKEGEKTRKELLKQWHSSKTQLELQDLQQFATSPEAKTKARQAGVSIRNFVSSAISAVVGDDWGQESEKLTSTRPKKAKKTASPQKFKGT